jgi:heme-degrading monooxygenase HmoA
MYARLTSVSIGSGLRPAAEKLADQYVAYLKKLKGFQNVLFLIGDPEGEYAVMTFWETQEDSEAAAELARPYLEGILRGILKKPIDTRLYEVYQPKDK